MSCTLPRDLFAWTVFVALVSACSSGSGTMDGGGACTRASDCPSGACVAGRCVPSDAGGRDGAIDGHGPDARGDVTQVPCGDGSVCPTGEYCQASSGRCVAATACAPDAGALLNPCGGDSHCVDGYCIPYNPGETNMTCTRPAVPAFLAPGVLCSYVDTSPASDPFHGFTSVSPSLVVVDFRFDPTTTEPHPSIVAPMHPGGSWGTANYQGVLRVLDGRTCAVQYTLDAHLVSGASSAAVGDLDGDGRAEIVASSIADTRAGVGDPTGGGLVAFTFDLATHTWRLLWRSHTAAGEDTNYAGTWASPSIADLDDDGVPEITLGGVVYDHNGLVLDQHLASAMTYWQGQFGVTADVDNDVHHLPELVSGAGIWSWNTATHAWMPATFFTPTTPLDDGLVAIADFGDFPGTVHGDPEIAVISSGTARVQTIHGDVVFGPITIPGGGTGGPPNAGDFNGDGHADFATAARQNYLVFDLQCVGSPVPTGCAANGIRWMRPNQDASSHSTGSSVFDFNGDGAAEAVYADECFTRVYDGSTGTVVFSRYRPSCTWYETPIVVDANGDLKAEIVVPDDDDCGIQCDSLAPNGYDSLFAGLRCGTSADCPDTTMACDAGLCRCTSDAQCGDTGYGCRTPDAGTGGAGNVCRALVGTRFGGVQVFGDPHGRWTPSRPVWNQHAYSVTDVGDTGTIPASHARAQNWLTPGLNNFRENTQGNLSATSVPELTVQGATASMCFLSGTTGELQLAASVCNRGTGPAAAGVPVAFESATGDGGAQTACTGTTTVQLAPGACTTVTCSWINITPSDSPYTVTVIPDPMHATLQCLESADAFSLAVSCPPSAG